MTAPAYKGKRGLFRMVAATLLLTAILALWSVATRESDEMKGTKRRAAALERILRQEADIQIAMALQREAMVRAHRRVAR